MFSHSQEGNSEEKSLIQRAGLTGLKPNEEKLIADNGDLQKLLQEYLSVKEQIVSFRSISDWVNSNQKLINISNNDIKQIKIMGLQALLAEDLWSEGSLLPFKDLIRTHIEEYAKAADQNARRTIESNGATINSALITTNTLIKELAEISTKFPVLAVAGKAELQDAISNLAIRTKELADNTKKLANINYSSTTSQKWQRRCVGALQSLGAIASYAVLTLFIMISIVGILKVPDLVSDCAKYVKKQYRDGARTSTIAETCDTLNDVVKISTKISKAVNLQKPQPEDTHNDSQEGHWTPRPGRP